ASKLSEAPGVGLVSLGGGQRPAIRIQVSPVALAAHGLALEDVRTAIGNANVNQAKGSFDGPLRASTSSARRTTTATSCSCTGTARHCASRTSPPWSTAPRT